MERITIQLPHEGAECLRPRRSSRRGPASSKGEEVTEEGGVGQPLPAAPPAPPSGVHTEYTVPFLLLMVDAGLVANYSADPEHLKIPEMGFEVASPTGNSKPNKN